jgi:hypothetical protein
LGANSWFAFLDSLAPNRTEQTEQAKVHALRQDENGRNETQRKVACGLDECLERVERLAFGAPTKFC